MGILLTGAWGLRQHRIPRFVLASTPSLDAGQVIGWLEDYPGRNTPIEYHEAHPADLPAIWAATIETG
jgi:hypothetical protein